MIWFKTFLSEDINILLKSVMSLVYRWRGMALGIIFWFKIDQCLYIKSDGIVCTLTFMRWWRPSAFFGRNGTIYIYANFCGTNRLCIKWQIIRPVICDGRHFIYIWKALACGIMLLGGKLWSDKTSLTLSFSYWSTCPKPVERPVIC